MSGRWGRRPLPLVGLAPCMLRSIPANAAAFTAYELPGPHRRGGFRGGGASGGVAVTVET